MYFEYNNFRETKAEHETNADAERDDRCGDRFNHRRGDSDGRAQNSAHAGGRAEQVSDGGSWQTNENDSHPTGAEVSRGKQSAHG